MASLNKLLDDLEAECDVENVDPTKRDRAKLRALLDQVYANDPAAFDAAFGVGSFDDPARIADPNADRLWTGIRNTRDRCKLVERCLLVVDALRNAKKKKDVDVRNFKSSYGWQSDWTEKQGNPRPSRNGFKADGVAATDIVEEADPIVKPKRGKKA